MCSQIYSNIIQVFIRFMKAIYSQVRHPSHPGGGHASRTCHMTQFEQSDWLRSENFINIMIEYVIMRWKIIAMNYWWLNYVSLPTAWKWFKVSFDSYTSVNGSKSMALVNILNPMMHIWKPKVSMSILVRDVVSVLKTMVKHITYNEMTTHTFCFTFSSRKIYNCAIIWTNACLSSIVH